MNDAQTVKLSRLRLDDFPLPTIEHEGGTNARGSVLIVGGSDQMPGAIKLSGIGALRAGASAVNLATSANITTLLGLSVPDASVTALPITDDGEIDVELAHASLSGLVANATAVLVGPGMVYNENAADFLRWMIAEIAPQATLVIDGPIVQALAHDDTMLQALEGRAILALHVDEMAMLLEIPRDEMNGDAEDIAEHCANRFRATVVFKGAETWISAIDTMALCYRDAKAGVDTSASGNVLSGVIAGLAARGASTMTASAWAVWAHGSAGNKLARSVAPTGFLASELLSEIPALLHR